MAGAAALRGTSASRSLARSGGGRSNPSGLSRIGTPAGQGGASARVGRGVARSTRVYLPGPDVADQEEYYEACVVLARVLGQPALCEVG